MINKYFKLITVAGSLLFCTTNIYAYSLESYAYLFAYGAAWRHCSVKEFSRPGCECITACFARGMSDELTTKEQHDELRAQCVKSCKLFIKTNN